MPHKDPEVRRAYEAAYRARNAEKRRAQTRQWQIENKDRAAEHKRAYAQRNKEKAAEASRRYRARNPEKVAESNRKYREKNAERLAARDKQWREQNPGKVKVQIARAVKRRRARMKEDPEYAIARVEYFKARRARKGYAPRGPLPSWLVGTVPDVRIAGTTVHIAEVE